MQENIQKTAIDLVRRYGDWVVAHESDRISKRQDSSIEELKQFYGDVFPHVRQLINFVDSRLDEDVSDLRESVRSLLMSLCEVDSAVNKWKHPRLKLGVDNLRFRVMENEFDRKGADRSASV